MPPSLPPDDLADAGPYDLHAQRIPIWHGPDGATPAHTVRRCAAGSPTVPLAAAGPCQIVALHSLLRPGSWCLRCSAAVPELLAAWDLRMRCMREGTLLLQLPPDPLQPPWLYLARAARQSGRAMRPIGARAWAVPTATPEGGWLLACVSSSLLTDRGLRAVHLTGNAADVAIELWEPYQADHPLHTLEAVRRVVDLVA